MVWFCTLASSPECSVDKNRVACNWFPFLKLLRDSTVFVLIGSAGARKKAAVYLWCAWSLCFGLAFVVQLQIFFAENCRILCKKRTFDLKLAVVSSFTCLFLIGARVSLFYWSWHSLSWQSFSNSLLPLLSRFCCQVLLVFFSRTFSMPDDRLRLHLKFFVVVRKGERNCSCMVLDYVISRECFGCLSFTNSRLLNIDYCLVAVRNVSSAVLCWLTLAFRGFKTLTAAVVQKYSRRCVVSFPLGCCGEPSDLFTEDCLICVQKIDLKLQSLALFACQLYLTFRVYF